LGLAIFASLLFKVHPDRHLRQAVPATRPAAPFRFASG